MCHAAIFYPDGSRRPASASAVGEPSPDLRAGARQSHTSLPAPRALAHSVRRSARTASRHRSPCWRCRSGYSARHPPYAAEIGRSAIPVRVGAGRTSMAERLGSASQSCRLAAGPLNGLAARARRLCVRPAGLARRMSARFARASQRSPGPAASAGLTRFALLRLRPGGGGAATRHSGYRRRRRLLRPAGNGTAASTGGLRGW